jgi:hypothetical protein
MRRLLLSLSRFAPRVLSSVRASSVRASSVRASSVRTSSVRTSSIQASSSCLSSALAASLVTLASACGGTETGNPPLDGTLSVNAHSSDSVSVALRAPEGGAVVEELWIGFGDVLVERCDDDAPFVVTDLGVREHADEAADRHAFLAAQTAICRVRARFVRADSGPDAIRSRSTLVRGNDAAGVPFEIALPLDTDLVVSFDALELDESNAALLLAVDVARWIGGLDLASGELDPDGVLRIDETKNPTLRDAFLARVAEGFELYRDDDADGIADPGELLLGRGE